MPHSTDPFFAVELNKQRFLLWTVGIQPGVTSVTSCYGIKFIPTGIVCPAANVVGAVQPIRGRRKLSAAPLAAPPGFRPDVRGEQAI